MVSAAKAFSSEPPRRPLTDLHAIVEDFGWRYVDRKKTDQVIEFCRVAETFSQAVRRAVESRDEDGKHHNHQSKVDIIARRKFGNKIIVMARAGRVDLMDFQEFHNTLDRIKPYGIGPVTVYDVAVRVGAYLGVKPTSVYLHAGVRQGLVALAKALMRRGDSLGETLYDARRWEAIPVRVFPAPLDKMEADDVEDILCTYREVFNTWT